MGGDDGEQEEEEGSSVLAFEFVEAFVVAVVGATLCGFAELKYLPPPGLEEKNEYVRREVANGSGWRILLSIESSDEASEKAKTGRYAVFETQVISK